MHIELPPHLEQAILIAFNNGDFGLVANQLAEALRDNSAQVVLSPNTIADARLRSWKEFEVTKTPEQIAREQGVAPFRGEDDLAFRDWPEADTVDAFLARAKGIEPETCR